MRARFHGCRPFSFTEPAGEPCMAVEPTLGELIEACRESAICKSIKVDHGPN